MSLVLRLNLMSVDLRLVDSSSQKCCARAHVILTLAKRKCYDTIPGCLVLYVLVIYCCFL